MVLTCGKPAEFDLFEVMRQRIHERWSQPATNMETKGQEAGGKKRAMQVQ
jgi:hypothetical protein